MDQVIETFKVCDKSGAGLISYTELSTLLRTVDPGITEENFHIMMEETGSAGKDKMKFEDFVSWLNGDRGPPEIIKADTSEDVAAAKAEAEEEDEEQSVDGGEEIDLLALETELVGIDLDMDQRITRKEWIAIMSQLGTPVEEASDLFDDITEECKKEGLGTPEEGFPIREFLQELKIEVDDMESLKAIAQAAAAAKTQQDRPYTADPEKAINVAINRVVRELDKAGRPADDAWDIFQEGKVPASKNQKKLFESFADKKDELVAKVKANMISPVLVGACAGQLACREACVDEVAAIIAKCKADGTKFTDPEWDLTTNPNEALYVNHTSPGYDCTVGKPAGYKRLTEITQDPVLFKDAAKAADIVQGQIGTCFLLGAMGAVVVKNASNLRKMFLAHDTELGIYGVRFCVDGEWQYVIVDDWMPVNAQGQLLYAHGQDPQEVWCPIIEKAYCKLHTCYEMCDGGFSTEAIYNFFGGVSAKIPVTEAHQKDPSTYFALLKKGRERGWLMTTHFAPKKGAMGGQGKCGEATFDSGLVGGHCYSILKCVEACGNQLVCCRNPWGTGEWKGKWSDQNAQGEWTPEMKEATGMKGKNDGAFWMSIQDFVANIGDVSYARPFGPQWKKLTQYKRFQKGGMTATAKFTYGARAGDEISIQKGAQVEVKALSAGWWYGKQVGGDKEGYFPGNYVRLNDRPIARFDLVGQKAEGVDLMSVVVLLCQPDSTRMRKFYKRKEDGLDYKDTSYSCIQLCIVNPEGKVHVKKRARRREVWAELQIPGGEGWKIYAYSVDGTGDRFILRTYVKDGTATLKEVPGADISELSAAIANR